MRYVTAGEVAKIRSRHAGIVTPSLDGMGVVEEALAEARAHAEDEAAQTAEIADEIEIIGYAFCPHHAPAQRTRSNRVIKQRTGLIVVEGVRVFREHDRSVGAMRFRCPGSGLEWNDRMTGSPGP